VIRVVFVHTWVHDVADDHGLNVVEEYVRPHTNDSYSKPIANKQDCLVLQRVTDRYRSDDEATVWD
jgi:hypothetical protein